VNWWILLPTAATIIIGVIGYLMNRSIVEMDKKIDESKQRIDEMSTKLDQSNARQEKVVNDLRKEFYEYKDKAADEFARKDDFILATAGIEKKIDKVYDILLDLKGRVR